MKVAFLLAFVALAQAYKVCLKDQGFVFPAPIGIDYYETSDALMVSVHYPNGQPFNFAILSADGSITQFSNVAGLTDEVKIAGARDQPIEKVPPGTLFTGNGIGGQILRINPDGTIINPWVALPGEPGLLRGSLYVDRTGAWGYNLIVVTTTGGIWVVDLDTNVPSKVAQTNPRVHLEGLITVPDTPEYKSLAGAIIAGAENEGDLWVVKPGGSLVKVPLPRTGGGFWRVEDIDLNDKPYNFFGVFYPTKILTAQTPFLDRIGGILITTESPATLGWLIPGDTLAETTVEPITYSTEPGCFSAVGQWEHVTLAGAGLGNVPSTRQFLCPYFESSVCNTAFLLNGTSYEFYDFNAVIFNDFKASTGDTEGRLIVRGDLTLGNGYSIGYLLPAGEKPFSAIVAGSGVWGSGAIFSGGLYVAEDFAYTGGFFDDRTGGPASGTESTDLESAFASAYECYTEASGKFAAKATNVEWQLKYNGIIITCPVATASLVLNLTAAEFNKIKWYCLDNCQSDAQWIINIDATEGPVNFQGDYISAFSGYATYNVYSKASADINTCNAVVNVKTAVNGNILAPTAHVNQLGGVIIGKLIACEFNSSGASQINLPCTTNQTAATQTYVEVSNGDSVQVVAACSVKPGDQLKTDGGDTVTVKSVQGSVFALDGAVSAGQNLKGQYSGIRFDKAAWSTPQEESSGVSLVASFVLALVALVAAF